VSAGLRADLVLGAVTLVWGSSFVVVRHALDDAPPLALLFWRFFLAALLTGALAAQRPKSRAALRDGLVLGFLLALGMSLQVVGQAETTASKAGFLTGLAVVLTPFVAFFRTRKLPSVENGLGIALACAGFFLLTFPAAGGPVSRGDLFVAAVGISPWFALVPLFSLLFAVSDSFAFVGFSGIYQRGTPDAIRGRMFAAVGATTTFASAAGYGFAGFLVTAVGWRLVYLAGGIIDIACAAILALALRMKVSGPAENPPSAGPGTVRQAD